MAASTLSHAAIGLRIRGPVLLGLQQARLSFLFFSFPRVAYAHRYLDDLFRKDIEYNPFSFLSVVIGRVSVWMPQFPIGINCE